jgi:spermidine synthase
MARDVGRPRAALLLMVASGFAGLGYQIVWTQQCALWLGHESAAVLAVVAAFFGGLGAGALVFGPRIERSLRPLRWYSGCEFVIAAWSLLLGWAMPAVSAQLLRLTGVAPAPLWQWTVAFAGTFVLLLPATAAMGATLPAMERITAGLPAAGASRSLSALYAGNTFGAVLGVLATAFWLVPQLGLQRTAGICVALNLLCGVAAQLVFPALGRPPAASARSHARGIRVRLVATGLLGIGYEVLVVRVLGQVTENTVYTFALLLAVYLVGSAAGAAAHQRWLLPRPSDDDERSDRLLAAAAAACLVGAASLWLAEATRTLALQQLGGPTTAARALVAEAVPALLAFGPPTFVMGALFSHLSRCAHARGVGFGRALGVNTLGAAAAPVLFGVLGCPALGPKFALLLVAAGYLALVTPRRWIRQAVLPAAAALALALLAPPLAFIDVPAGGRVISHENGVMATVSVVEDAEGVARLRINNRQQEGSSATLRMDGRQAWLPLLLHPAPRQVLFLGLGTGITAAAAAQDPSLEVDAVELLPEVIRAAALFGRAAGDAHTRLHVHAADARRYLRAADRRFDVIVSDNFHPARSGSGSLYTVEHFQAVHARLAAGGLFCQWLPLHQLDLATLRSIVQSFLVAYPQATALIASNSLETPVLGLVGRPDATRFDAAQVRDRLARGPQPQPFSTLGFEDEFAVLGSFVAGPAQLRRFAASAAANTDDHPVVAYQAPLVTYAPDSRPRDRLIDLLREISIAPAQLIAPAADPAWTQRLAGYWAARDRFILSGRDVRPSPRVQEMLAQVREPLLSILRMSPDFRPAYDPLIAMATALARSDVTGARTLLTELTQIQPARPEASQALALLLDHSATLDLPAR